MFNINANFFCRKQNTLYILAVGSMSCFDCNFKSLISIKFRNNCFPICVCSSITLSHHHYKWTRFSRKIVFYRWILLSIDKCTNIWNTIRFCEWNTDCWWMWRWKCWVVHLRLEQIIVGAHVIRFIECKKREKEE